MNSSITNRLMVALEGYETLDLSERVKHLTVNISKIKALKKSIDAAGIVLDHKKLISFLCVNQKFVTKIEGCEKDTIEFSKELPGLVKSYYVGILNSIRTNTPAPIFHKHFDKLKTFKLLCNSELLFEDHPACSFVSNGLPYGKSVVKSATNKTPGVALGLGTAMGLTGLAFGGPVGLVAGAALGVYLGTDTVNGNKLHELQGDSIKSSNTVDHIVHFLEQMVTLERSIKSIQAILNSLEKIKTDELVKDQDYAVMAVKHLILSSVEQFELFIHRSLTMSQDIISNR
jgi:hypothetical protein